MVEKVEESKIEENLPSNTESAINLSEPNQSLDNISFDIVATIPPNPISEISFDILSETPNMLTDISFDILSEIPDNTDSFDHLSNIDLNDEWISESAAESIISFRSGISHVSHYSSVDILNDEQIEKGFRKPRKISTKRNITIPDGIMRKIIWFVQNFSNELKEMLGQLRGGKMLLIKEQNPDPESIIILKDETSNSRKEE